MDKERDDRLHKFKQEQAEAVRLIEEKKFSNAIGRTLRILFDNYQYPLYDRTVDMQDFDPLVQ